MIPTIRQLAMTAAVCAVGLTGCRSKHLVFTTYTKVGVDIAATDAQPTQAMFGYKRFEGAIIPVDPDASADADGDNVPDDAKSVYAWIALENGWLSGLTIQQVFATGHAAVQAANNPSTGLSNVMGKSEKKNGGE